MLISKVDHTKALRAGSEVVLPLAFEISEAVSLLAFETDVSE